MLNLIASGSGASKLGVLVACSTGASNTSVSTSATVLVAPVLATMVLVAGSTGATGTRASSTGATLIEAPVLLTMCYKHQCSKHIANGTVYRAISSVCYGTSGMSIRLNGTVFSRALPKN